MITFNEILFIQMLAGLLTINSILRIILGFLGTERKTQYDLGDVADGILMLGLVIVAITF